MTGLTIAGPTSVNEGATATYTATARYSDGSSQAVAPSWSSSAGSITSSGVFTAPQVTANQTVSINASYGGISAPAYSVTVVNVAATLSSIAISGAASVNEGTSSPYTATATWSDGSTTNVTSSATWTASIGTISAGAFTAPQVTANQTATIGASYTSGGTTRTASASVTVVNVAATLSSIAISGAASVNEGTSSPYTATATWSDGSTTNVTSSATWTASIGTISAGAFTAPQVTANQTATIGASYTSGGTTRTASASVTVVNVAATLTDLTIGSPTSVPEKTSASYTAIASWSDGNTTNVTSAATWSVAPGTYASINGGVLVASEVPSDQTVTVSASYTSDGVTKNASMTVTITDTAPPATGPLTIVPSDGAADVPVNTVIRATVSDTTDIRTVFNKGTFTLKPETLAAASSVGALEPLTRDDGKEQCVVNGVVQGSIWYNWNRTKAVFSPDCDLRRNAAYVATVAVGSSGYLAQPVVSRFTTVMEYPDSDGDGSDDGEDDHPYDRRRSSRWSAYETGKFQIDASYVSGSATSAPAGAAGDGSALRGVAAISDTSARLNQAGRPEGFEFPDGMVSFTMDNVASGGSVTVKITFPSGIPAGSKVMQADESGFHEVMDAAIKGSMVTMTLTAPPAGSGDQGNAIAVGPIGVAAPVTTGSGSVDLSTAGSSGGCSTAGRTGAAGIDAFLVLTGIGLMAWRIRRYGTRS